MGNVGVDAKVIGSRSTGALACFTLWLRQFPKIICGMLSMYHTKAWKNCWKHG